MADSDIPPRLEGDLDDVPTDSAGASDPSSSIEIPQPDTPQSDSESPTTLASHPKSNSDSQSITHEDSPQEQESESDSSEESTVQSNGTTSPPSSDSGSNATSPGSSVKDEAETAEPYNWQLNDEFLIWMKRFNKDEVYIEDPVSFEIDESYGSLDSEEVANGRWKGDTEYSLWLKRYDGSQAPNTEAEEEEVSNVTEDEETSGDADGDKEKEQSAETESEESKDNQTTENVETNPEASAETTTTENAEATTTEEKAEATTTEKKAEATTEEKPEATPEEEVERKDPLRDTNVEKDVTCTLHQLTLTDDEWAENENLSPSEAEWKRQKKEHGQENEYLDKIMSMVGLEEVKAHFMAVKSSLEAARRRDYDRKEEMGDELKDEDKNKDVKDLKLNILLAGNLGTGKSTIAKLYESFLRRMKVVGGTSERTIHHYRRTEARKASSLLDKVEAQTAGSVWVASHRDLESANEISAAAEGRWLFPTVLQLKDYTDDELVILSKRLLKKRGLKFDGDDSELWHRVIVRRVARTRGSSIFGNVCSLESELNKVCKRQAARLKGEWSEWLSKEDVLKAKEAELKKKDEEEEAAIKKKEEVEEENRVMFAEEAARLMNIETEESSKEAKQDEKNEEGKGDTAQSEVEKSVVEESNGDQTTVEKAAAEDTVGEVHKVEEEKPIVQEPKVEVDKPGVQESKAEDEKLDVQETKKDEEKPDIQETKADAAEPDVEETKANEEKSDAQETTSEEAKPNDQETKAEEEKPEVEDAKVDEAASKSEDAEKAATEETPAEKTLEEKIAAGEIILPTHACATELEAHEDNKPDNFIVSKEDVFGSEPSDIRERSSAYKKLQKMVGLSSVKESIEELLTRAKANYDRELQGKEPLQTKLNKVFLGPPGTGKTTVATLFAEILADLGLLSSGEVIFKNPTDLLAMYIGESEKKTKKALTAAMGKVLVLDDAHMLYNTRHGNNDTDIFRVGIVDTLVANISGTMGEDRCIILAGYEDQMKEMFMNMNPGLQRRFPLEDAFTFENYTDEELSQILKYKLEEEEMEMTEEAQQVAEQVLSRMRICPNFGNGGDIDNLLSRAKIAYRKNPPKSSEEPLADPTKMVLEPQHFDPDYNRASHASEHCTELFKDFVGFNKIIDFFQHYQELAVGMRLCEVDPRPYIPWAFVFKGPPGTGKTSTARKVGQLYYDMNILSSPEVVSCSVTDLIGQYVGHTGPKVKAQLEKGLGKVLFIDEAYRLAGSGSKDFTEEAVGELVDAMTNPRYVRNMIIILAGYTAEMDALMKTNQGLRGRFADQVVFPDMEPAHCLDHLKSSIGKLKIEIVDKEAIKGKREWALRLFKKMSETEGWANARDVETLANKIIGNVFKEQAKTKNVGGKRTLSVTMDAIVKLLLESIKERDEEAMNSGAAHIYI